MTLVGFGEDHELETSLEILQRGEGHPLSSFGASLAHGRQKPSDADFPPLSALGLGGLAIGVTIEFFRDFAEGVPTDVEAQEFFLESESLSVIPVGHVEELRGLDALPACQVAEKILLSHRPVALLRGKSQYQQLQVSCVQASLCRTSFPG